MPRNGAAPHKVVIRKWVAPDDSISARADHRALATSRRTAPKSRGPLRPPSEVTRFDPRQGGSSARTSPVGPGMRHRPRRSPRYVASPANLPLALAADGAIPTTCRASRSRRGSPADRDGLARRVGRGCNGFVFVFFPSRALRTRKRTRQRLENERQAERLTEQSSIRFTKGGDAPTRRCAKAPSNPTSRWLAVFTPRTPRPAVSPQECA